MQVSRNRIVSFHYALKVTGEEFSETSLGGDPVSYLHGHDGVIPGLEDAMSQREPGDRFSVTVTPDRGYGQYVARALQRVPIKRLVKPGKLVAGKQVVFDGAHGRQQGTVVKVGRFNVDLDTNHPLAGKTLVFDIEVIDVREATPEELAHGHAHGPGGAHH